MKQISIDGLARLMTRELWKNGYKVYQAVDISKRPVVVIEQGKGKQIRLIIEES